MNLPPFTTLSCPFLGDIHHRKIKHFKQTVICRKYTFVLCDFPKLTIEAFYGSGAKLIGANSDISGPIENGIAPACRALVSPIELATGKQAYFCGKPNPLMMRTGLNIFGCHSAEAVIVGDRLRGFYLSKNVNSYCLSLSTDG